MAETKENIIKSAHSIVGNFTRGEKNEATEQFESLMARIGNMSEIEDKQISSLVLDLEFLVNEHGSVTPREIYTQLVEMT